MPSQALIIFVKNPIEGKVKTRIAKSVGHPKAVEIYRELLDYTRKTAGALPPENYLKVVYYGDFINDDDLWNGWQKALQPQDGDLGDRMKQAFAEQFARGANCAVVIGSDCLALKTHHLQEAFRQLQEHDVVLGPSTDGGYYLLGMRKLYEDIFDNMPWSRPELMKRTRIVLEENNISHYLLEPLTDIDEWEDYLNEKR